MPQFEEDNTGYEQVMGKLGVGQMNEDRGYADSAPNMVQLLEEVIFNKKRFSIAEPCYRE